MADEETIIAPVQAEDQSRAQERIKQLSDKVELTSKERDEFKALNDTITRERDFYAGFTDVVATNPAAKDHKDDILAKVKSGYTVEDAALAVLAKAGKLGGQTSAPEPQTPAGGSATTTMSQNASKPVNEMTAEEKRAQLEKDLLWQ